MLLRSEDQGRESLRFDLELEVWDHLALLDLTDREYPYFE